MCPPWRTHPQGSNFKFAPLLGKCLAQLALGVKPCFDVAPLSASRPAMQYGPAAAPAAASGGVRGQAAEQEQASGLYWAQGSAECLASGPGSSCGAGEQQERWSTDGTMVGAWRCVEVVMPFAYLVSIQRRASAFTTPARPGDSPVRCALSRPWAGAERSRASVTRCWRLLHAA